LEGAAQDTKLDGVDDDEIKVLVKRLARAHPSGGTVIERAAIMAEGTGSSDVMAWVIGHGGVPEAAVKTAAPRGIHGWRLGTDDAPAARSASRYVLPVGALD
jgi:hypothetical protein